MSAKRLTERVKHQVADDIRSYTLAEITRDFQQLQAIGVHAHKTNPGVRTGNKTVDYFTFYERLHTVGKEGVSFFDFYRNRHEYAKRASVQRLRQLDAKNDAENWYEIFRLYFGSINIFRPLVAMEIYAKYKPTCVLDPTMGWGGRLIGACALNVPKYIGIELNEHLRAPYRDMKRFLSPLCDTQIELHFQNALRFNYQSVTYDMVLTSPPYYNLEIYNGVPTYTDEADWNERFYKPLFTAVYAGLKRGGHLCINVPDVIYHTVMVPLLGRATRRHMLRRSRTKSTAYEEYVFVWEKK